MKLAAFFSLSLVGSAFAVPAPQTLSPINILCPTGEGTRNSQVNLFACLHRRSWTSTFSSVLQMVSDRKRGPDSIVCLLSLSDWLIPNERFVGSMVDNAVSAFFWNYNTLEGLKQRVTFENSEGSP